MSHDCPNPLLGNSCRRDQSLEGSCGEIAAWWESDQIPRCGVHSHSARQALVRGMKRGLSLHKPHHRLVTWLRVMKREKAFMNRERKLGRSHRDWIGANKDDFEITLPTISFLQTKSSNPWCYSTMKALSGMSGAQTPSGANTKAAKVPCAREGSRNFHEVSPARLVDFAKGTEFQFLRSEIGSIHVHFYNVN